MTPSYQVLQGLIHNVREEEIKLADLELKLYQQRLEAIRAKDDLGREISLASLNAYNSGAITGKNEAVRKLELEGLLSSDKTVLDLRKLVVFLEDSLGDLEREAGYQRAQVRYHRNIFDAALATARGATVPGELLATDEAEPRNGKAKEIPF